MLTHSEPVVTFQELQLTDIPREGGGSASLGLGGQARSDAGFRSAQRAG
jgi:hypothetical protein